MQFDEDPNAKHYDDGCRVPTQQLATHGSTMARALISEMKRKSGEYVALQTIIERHLKDALTEYAASLGKEQLPLGLTAGAALSVFAAMIVDLTMRKLREMGENLPLGYKTMEEAMQPILASYQMLFSHLAGIVADGAFVEEIAAREARAAPPELDSVMDELGRILGVDLSEKKEETDAETEV